MIAQLLTLIGRLAGPRLVPAPCKAAAPRTDARTDWNTVVLSTDDFR
ncbi:MAG: hypothetical protein JO048_02855 [Methylobacteriaceae bacterium]|nr:hypothetical protein [Methylobacteriaceae bacterium]